MRVGGHLLVVILNDDDTASARGCMLDDGLPVDRLDREGIHHAAVDARLFQLGGRVQCLVQRDAGANQQDRVVGRLLYDLGLANLWDGK